MKGNEKARVCLGQSGHLPCLIKTTSYKHAERSVSQVSLSCWQLRLATVTLKKTHWSLPVLQVPNTKSVINKQSLLFCVAGAAHCEGYRKDACNNPHQMSAAFPGREQMPVLWGGSAMRNGQAHWGLSVLLPRSANIPVLIKHQWIPFPSRLMIR